MTGRARERAGGGRRTYGGDEVDDEEGVEDGDYGGSDGSDDVSQALEPPKEPQDSEGPQHLEGARAVRASGWRGVKGRK